MTNKIKLDKLVHALGMEPELRPLLDSNINGESSGYVRFEKAIGEVLNERQVISSSEFYGRFGWGGGNMPERACRMTKEYYGIGCEDKSFEKIGSSEDICRDRVSQVIKKVARILRSPYSGVKRNIWYKTLG